MIKFVDENQVIDTSNDEFIVLFKEIEEAEAFELIERGYKAVTVDNEYHVADYYSIIQLVVLYKEAQPTHDDVRKFYNITFQRCVDDCGVYEFRGEQSVGCDSVWYFIYK